MTTESDQLRATLTRRHFFGRSAAGIAGIALASLLNETALGGAEGNADTGAGVAGFPNFKPRAKRVIYLFQSGAPSQLDLFDYKPKLAGQHGVELPDSVRMGQRLTGMTSGQASFPIAPTKFRFAQHGGSGAWVSELMPHVAAAV